MTRTAKIDLAILSFAMSLGVLGVISTVLFN